MAERPWFCGVTTMWADLKRTLSRLTPEMGWGELPPVEGRLWTDDYSDLLGAFQL